MKMARSFTNWGRKVRKNGGQVILPSFGHIPRSSNTFKRNRRDTAVEKIAKNFLQAAHLLLRHCRLVFKLFSLPMQCFGQICLKMMSLA